MFTSKYLSDNISIARLNDRHQYWELADPDTPDPYKEAITEINAEIKRLLALKKEIKFLLLHECDFDGNDYCCICGKDGRA